MNVFKMFEISLLFYYLAVCFVYQFQNLTIKNLDRLVTSGKGDEQFKKMFNTIMSQLCENDFSMREQVIKINYILNSKTKFVLPLILFL